MPVLLIHSPLLFPISWSAVADLIADAAVPDLRPALVPPYYESVSRAACAGLSDPTDVTLVGHSRAGALLPAIAARLGPAVRKIVYVDARLPHPGRTWLSTLSPEQADRMRALCDQGTLASWDRWFAPSMMAELVPDPAVRDRLVESLPRLPWGMLTETAPSDVLPAVPLRYVQLSPAYAADAQRAEDEGFEVVRADTHHLALMTDPALVRRLCFGTGGHGE